MANKILVFEKLAFDPATGSYFNLILIDAGSVYNAYIKDAATNEFPSLPGAISSSGATPIIAPSGVGDVVGFGTTDRLMRWTDGPNSVAGDSILAQVAGGIDQATGGFKISGAGRTSPVFGAGGMALLDSTMTGAGGTYGAVFTHAGAPAGGAGVCFNIDAMGVGIPGFEIDVTSNSLDFAALFFGVSGLILTNGFIALGGNVNTFAAIKGTTSGAVLQARLGDDTGPAGFQAKEVIGAFVSSPVTVSADDTGKVFSNEGAAALAVYNLPAAAAGLTYTFVVQDADGIQIDAQAGDTIRLATSVSSSGGTATSTDIGSALILVALNATEWMARSIVGAWVTA